MSASLSRAAATTALATALLLMVPLVAMQFTKEVNWGIGDFVVAGALLFGAGMTYCVAARRARNRMQRFAIATLVLAVLGIVWAELAVGLFT